MANPLDIFAVGGKNVANTDVFCYVLQAQNGASQRMSNKSFGFNK